MVKGELEKRAFYVIDADSNDKKPIEGLEWRSSKVVRMSNIDEAKKEFWNYFNTAPNLADYFEEEGKKVTDAYVEYGKKLCKKVFGDSL